MEIKHPNLSLQEFKQKCSSMGLKMTPQRLVIFEELSKAKDHPSCEDIYQRVNKAFPHISFDTVYRTLTTFCKIGVVRPVEGYGEKKRYDPNMQNHHHLRCLHCQAIIDFYHPSYDKIAVPEKIRKAFKVVNRKVVLEGVCKNCQP